MVVFCNSKLELCRARNNTVYTAVLWPNQGKQRKRNSLFFTMYHASIQKLKRGGPCYPYGNISKQVWYIISQWGSTFRGVVHQGLWGSLNDSQIQIPSVINPLFEIIRITPNPKFAKFEVFPWYVLFRIEQDPQLQLWNTGKSRLIRMWIMQIPAQFQTIAK